MTEPYGVRNNLHDCTSSAVPLVRCPKLSRACFGLIARGPEDGFSLAIYAEGQAAGMIRASMRLTDSSARYLGL